MLTTFKYDMRVSAKRFAPLYAVVFFIVSVFILPLRYLVFPKLDVSVFISGNRYIYAAEMLFSILAYIVPLYLYYISAFGRQSILTEMLPVSSASKLFSKVLCTIIWYSVSYFAYFSISIIVCAVCDFRMFSFYLTGSAIKSTIIMYFFNLPEIIFAVLLSIAILSPTLRLKFGRSVIITLIYAVMIPLLYAGYTAFCRYFLDIIKTKFPDKINGFITTVPEKLILFIPLSCITFLIAVYVENRRKPIR